MHGGAEACLAAADVFLARPGLAPLVALVEGARRTMRVIRRNIVFSLVYNLVGATLAMLGVIDPLIAAVLMPMSSLTVVLALVARPHVRRGGCAAARRRRIVRRPPVGAGPVSVMYVMLPIALVVVFAAVAGVRVGGAAGAVRRPHTPAMRALHDDPDETKTPPTP